jgi:thioredoxin-related protein
MLFCIFAKKETMTTVIIDTQSKEAKRLVDYLKTINYVKVIEESQKDDLKYDPDFVAKIKKREKQASVKLDVDNLWK